MRKVRFYLEDFLFYLAAAVMLFAIWMRLWLGEP